MASSPTPPDDNPPNSAPGIAVNPFQHRAGPALSASYTILWYAQAMPPDVAVNEFRQGSSQRFGRDSFETRSTA